MYLTTAFLSLLLASSSTGLGLGKTEPSLGVAILPVRLDQAPVLEPWRPVATTESLSPVPEALDGLDWVELPGGPSKRTFSPSVVAQKTLCDTLTAAAAQHDMPVGFFARLIWQESRFDRWAVSHAGAQGMAQFMPKVAASMGLTDPHDPLQALPVSARLLSQLHQRFGNWGLAAAAYNGGANRIQKWLTKRGKLPKETRNYVLSITGHAPEKWIKSAPADLDYTIPARAPCQEQIAQLQGEQAQAHAALAAAAETATAHGSTEVSARNVTDASAAAKVEQADPPGHREHGSHKSGGARMKVAGRVVLASADPNGGWGVGLAADFSETKAMARFEKIKKEHPAVLRNRKAVIAHRGHGKKLKQVRVVLNTRSSAQHVCAQLRAAGGACTVQKN
jgi:hypothetical protein